MSEMTSHLEILGEEEREGTTDRRTLITF